MGWERILMGTTTGRENDDPLLLEEHRGRIEVITAGAFIQKSAQHRNPG